MERKINNIADANKWVDKANVKTIITFRTQQLYDLWVNEFVGQISDGMWENSNRTEWIWRNVYVKLGNQTKVEVTSQYCIGRKSFGMTKMLWECVGDRIIAENGFRDEKDARAGWREIAEAIYNASQTKEAMDLSNSLKEEKRKVAASQSESLKKEWEDVGADTSNCTGSYWYASLDFNFRKEMRLDGVERETRSYLFLHVHTDQEGNLKHQVEYHNMKWYVPLGKLKDALEAIKEFDNKMRF